VTHDDDDLARLLADTLDAPADVVPRGHPDQDTLDELEAMAGKTVTVTFPGRPVYGPDGDLIGMTEPETHQAMLAPPVIDEQ
jgi:hypothetical protein